MAEGQNDPQGPYFYQEGGKTYASLPLGMIQGIQQSSLFEKMQKDCKAEGIKLPKDIMAKDPRTHVLTPQEYLRNVEAGTMPSMNNHNVLKEMAEKAAANDQMPKPSQNARTTKTQVTSVALQTDSCDTLYITKIH